MFWLKELITWGTLEPVAAYLLAPGSSSQDKMLRTLPSATSRSVRWEFLFPTNCIMWISYAYGQKHIQDKEQQGRPCGIRSVERRVNKGFQQRAETHLESATCRSWRPALLGRSCGISPCNVPSS